MKDMKGKMRVLRALLQKEIISIRRNKLVPRIIVMLPIMAMLVIPLVATMDVKHVNIAVVDNDHSELLRRIVADMDASNELSVNYICNTFGEAMTRLESGDIDVILTIPRRYEADIAGGVIPKVDVEANGVNATKGSLGAQYTVQSIAGTLSSYVASMGRKIAAPDVSVLNMYNPTLNFRNYMIPALIVILLIIICGFLPTLNLVGEKESGTIEAINVTPVGKFTFVMSKLIPYWIIGILVVTIGMAIGWLVYGLRPQGSILGFYLASILFSLVMSGLGLLIANKSNTMMQSIFVMFAVIMIFQLMSGLFTPIASMPMWAQYITYAVPPRYFIEIMRALYLRGTPMAELLPQYLSLAAFALSLSVLAAITYRKQN